ncbi:probable WRKY transcription factor 70 [Carica papaya]|uniref:probable WRKY transcription factor 70 n=1 Tax=Carica papaya TaxID=3649 RepID=UPI000B8CC603|nr:probable WRKY transcription factor 70 [Carica papaya]
MVFSRIQVIEELLRGRESAKKLQKLVDQPDLDSITKEDLASEILDSFTNTLSCYEISWDGHRSSDDSAESIKSKRIQDDNGSCKRRKSSHVWTTETVTLVADGFAWRKYGQKDILKANHPRSYFRCTHKNDQKCQATKQVQKIRDDPPLYRTTYYGHHTCKNLVNANHLVNESIQLGFSIINDSTKQDHTPFSISFPSSSSLKNECKQEVLTTNNQLSSSLSKYLLSPDLTTFESCKASTHHSLEMGVMEESVSVGFDDVFPFEF